MGEKNLTHKAMEIYKKNTIQQVLDILKAEDGRAFEEKKKDAIIAYIESQLKATVNDETGKNIKKQFWEDGDICQRDEHILIRAVQEKDKKCFRELQKETCPVKSMYKEEEYLNMMWNEHIQDKSMMFTIEVNGEYAGYCGINNLDRKNWELAIELLSKFRYKGIGFTAIGIMLSEIKTRIGVDKFRVKISPDNYASQRLFEKLGAIPYGIAEYMLHKEEDIVRFEEENLEELNEKLIEVAQKFGVEPRKLLSHVLEYELSWTK